MLQVNMSEQKCPVKERVVALLCVVKEKRWVVKGKLCRVDRCQMRVWQGFVACSKKLEVFRLGHDFASAICNVDMKNCVNSYSSMCKQNKVSRRSAAADKTAEDFQL